MTRRALSLLLLALMVVGCARPAPKGGLPNGATDLPTSPSQVDTAPPAGAPPEPAPPEPAPPPKRPSPPQAIIQPEQVLQGDFAILQMDKPVSGGDVRIRVEGLSEQPRLFMHEGLAVALIGFPAAARVGSYPVTLTWQGGEWTGSVEVIKKSFTEDRLWVSEEQEEIRTDPRSPAEWERIYGLRSTSGSRPLWEGPFVHPLGGPHEITTYFGEIRIVNGVETGRHSGMDFAADTGTPIYAPARGRVILAEPIILTGHTVIIDHGYNLFTAYYHCSALSVAAGEIVQQGQEIGLVGSTGFSTGPHLHWTATIGNTPVDPWPLTQTALLGVEPMSLDGTRHTPD